jgi:glycosyltransferase involved in cell wall biosynthesis
MRVLVFLNSLSLGGTEKAAVEWTKLLAQRPGVDSVSVVALSDGARRKELENSGIPVCISPALDEKHILADALSKTDVVHAHAPGFAHKGDLLGMAIRSAGRKIPVVQTNIFGKLENPQENEWTDFRLFISWTSCVQAAKRSKKALDLEFFRKQSVAVYPVKDPFKAASERTLSSEAAAFRKDLGLSPVDVLFGRFSRPERNKWTPLALKAFFNALKKNANIRLLLREPPPEVAENLLAAGKAVWGGDSKPSNSAPIVMLPATPDTHDLCIAQMACDAILHTSSIGESFGYGIAEPMALGKPIITNSVPWHDQAQIELVRHGECGFVASTVPTMKRAILRLAEDEDTRVSCGQTARQDILRRADPSDSTKRLLLAMECAIEGKTNPFAIDDLYMATDAANHLDHNQWGQTWDERWHLRGRSSYITLRALWQSAKQSTK